MIERKISGETIFQGRVFTVERDIIECNGSRAEREVIRHPGGVAVLALDDGGRVVMVRQYRYAAGKILLELPAGRLELGEDPVGAGARELSEETGYKAGDIRLMGHMLPTGGYDSEVIYLCVATNLEKGEPHPDEGEIVQTELIPFGDALGMVLSGEIEDGKTAYGLMRFALQRGGANG